jgi:hypothetical protein
VYGRPGAPPSRFANGTSTSNLAFLGAFAEARAELPDFPDRQTFYWRIALSTTLRQAQLARPDDTSTSPT